MMAFFSHSHLRRTGPPALVSEGDPSQAFSLGHPVLPGDFVLPQSHSGRFVLQLRQVLHTAVHLQVHTAFQLVLSSNDDGTKQTKKGQFIRVSDLDLAEARGAGREAMHLHRLVIVGVVFVVRLDVMVALRAG